MYYFILKKDLFNNDTSSLMIKQIGEGRTHTCENPQNYLIENDNENTIQFDKITNTCFVLYNY